MRLGMIDELNGAHNDKAGENLYIINSAKLGRFYKPINAKLNAMQCNASQVWYGSTVRECRHLLSCGA
jgi:hypothetical protein